MSLAADFGFTLTQHVMEKQALHPSARGQFSALLTQIGVASKLISAQVRRAGLIEIWGQTGETNVQGEKVQKLDRIANDTFMEVLRRSGSVAAMASEEEDDLFVVESPKSGDYVVAFDPLDGSTNIDSSVSIGTIFAIYRRRTVTGSASLADLLRPGNELQAAGYVLYGSSTVLTYTTGETVDSFTLDPSCGEFFLTRSNIKYSDITHQVAINEANEPYWPQWVSPFMDDLKARNTQEHRQITSRHVGSLVADFHRNLVKGGIYLYPTDSRTGQGKLRLLYECNPLAFIAEAAGGAAYTPEQRVLDVPLKSLHERAGLVIGPKADVELARKLAKQFE